MLIECFSCQGSGFDEYEEDDTDSEDNNPVECGICNGTGEVCDLCGEPDCYDDECDYDDDDIDVDDWDDDIDDEIEDTY